MELPELPKQIRGQEAKFGVEFRHWWNTVRLDGDFELKHTRGARSLSFDALEREQVVVGNLSNSAKGVLLRIAQGTVGAPDYSAHMNRVSWIVIRYPSAFYVISLQGFLKEKKVSIRKSLTEERAEEICTYSVKS